MISTRTVCWPAGTPSMVNSPALFVVAAPGSRGDHLRFGARVDAALAGHEWGLLMPTVYFQRHHHWQSGFPPPSRLYFATDLHGSEVCFRKFLHASDAYRASTVIMGGDCTGKMLVPVVGDEGGYRCTWHGEQLSFGEDNGELSLAGRATRPELVARYLESLRGEAALRGQGFSRLEIRRQAAAKGAAFVEFALSSEDKEAGGK